MNIKRAVKNIIGLSSLSLLMSVNANASITEFDDIAPALFDDINIGIVNLDFGFSIDYHGMSKAQLKLILETIHDGFENDVLSSMKSQLSQTENMLITYNDSVSLGNPWTVYMPNTQAEVDDLLTHNAFDPTSATNHKELLGNYSVAVGFKIALTEEQELRSVITEATELYIYNDLYWDLKGRNDETNNYISTNITFTSSHTDCGMIRSICYDYTVRDMFTNQSFRYLYADHGSYAGQAAGNKRSSLVNKYEDLLKGENFDQALAILKTRAGL